MSTPHGPERREQGLRRSGAAGPHDDRVTRTEALRSALADQLDEREREAFDEQAPGETYGAIGWTCPRCGSDTPPRETPAGTYCWFCHLKLETCCEGAPLPERKSP